jgi:hypothetical protein
MTELHPDEELDEGYWESLGSNQDQSPLDRPPGHDQNPFESDGMPEPRGSRYEPKWLTSDGGIEFIDVFIGEQIDNTDTHALVFLYEVITGRFNVGVCRPKTMKGSRFLVEDVDKAEAKAAATRAAGAMSVDAGINADWRHAPASQAQMGLITRMGLFDDGNDDDRTLTKGEASDLLNRHFDGQTLDFAFRKGST